MTAKPYAYRPRPGTPFGDAYAIAVDEIRGIAEPEEVQFLRDNPILWVRVLRLHEQTIQHRWTMAADQVATMKPEPGDNAPVEYLRARKEFRKRSNGWRHQVHMMKVRRAEIAMAAGFTSAREMKAVGDVALAFADIYAAARQDDMVAVEEISKLWADRLLHPDAEVPE